jgi:hypothetical protein
MDSDNFSHRTSWIFCTENVGIGVAGGGVDGGPEEEGRELAGKFWLVDNADASLSAADLGVSGSDFCGGLDKDGDSAMNCKYPYTRRQDYTLEIPVQSLVYLSYLWLETHPTLALQEPKAT